jgi:hypothetical protein
VGKFVDEVAPVMTGFWFASSAMSKGYSLELPPR